MGTPIDKLKQRWMKEPGFKSGYDALAPEFELAGMLIEARMRAELSQVELAERMGTSQSTVARLESGTSAPSLNTLRRFAEATGCEVRVTFVQARTRVLAKGTRAARAKSGKHAA
jgi:transcriptional regulator with XRE-family HTH domain